MKILLSPAKTFAKDVKVLTTVKTQTPLYTAQTDEIISGLQGWKPAKFEEVMGISHNLACLNHERYQTWNEQSTHPALAYFKGDVYQGLQVDDFDELNWGYAQDHVFMLSGLYGLLRANDGIKNYRLEMKTPWGGKSHKNLYEIWQPCLAPALNEISNEPIINLASNEYWRAIDTSKLKTPVITPVFKEKKGDQYKIVAIYAKKARGLMARYAVKNGISEPEDLKQFSVDNYKYNTGLSNNAEWVFVR